MKHTVNASDFDNLSYSGFLYLNCGKKIREVVKNDLAIDNVLNLPVSKWDYIMILYHWPGMPRALPMQFLYDWCVELLPLFEKARPGDQRPRQVLEYIKLCIQDPLDKGGPLRQMLDEVVMNTETIPRTDPTFLSEWRARFAKDAIYWTLREADGDGSFPGSFPSFQAAFRNIYSAVALTLSDRFDFDFHHETNIPIARDKILRDLITRMKAETQT